MCGIAGIFNLGGQPVSARVLQAMTDAIAHRGPDGEGFYLDRGLGLGHRRLAVIDTTPRGSQPMKSADGRWVISYNGEVYNFKALRRELEDRGCTFRSNSDTEVLLEGLAKFGISFLNQLDGMFALAAWCIPQRALYLARDRYGIKPIYYRLDGKTLLFGSEIKAILAHPGVSAELSLDALNEYFTFQNQLRFHTLFKGIHLLPPATIACLDARGSFEITTWWDYDFSNPDEGMTFEQAREETVRLLHEAVDRQLVSDVSVGSYLSGGIDSGSIVALAAHHIPRLTTFTAGFEMSEVDGIEMAFDERINAELMANRFKTEHYEQVINAGDIRWSLPRVVWHLEDLRMGMCYPNYYISRLASKFVKVCLTGTGGDELFGGYPWRYYRVFQSVGRDEYLRDYYAYWQRLVPDADKPRLFTQEVWNAVQGEDMADVFRSVFKNDGSMRFDTPEQHIQNSLYFEIKTFLAGLFVVGDKLAMANGLEERFPFMDNALVELSQRIPVRHKLGNLDQMKRIDENEFARNRKYHYQHTDGKNVLRKALENLLPKEVTSARKQGFSAPDESWYRGENAAYIREVLLDPKAAFREFINPSYVAQIIEEHIERRINHRLLIWSLLCFEWWCRLFLCKDGRPF